MLRTDKQWYDPDGAPTVHVLMIVPDKALLNLGELIHQSKGT